MRCVASISLATSAFNGLQEPVQLMCAIAPQLSQVLIYPVAEQQPSPNVLKQIDNKVSVTC